MLLDCALCPSYISASQSFLVQSRSASLPWHVNHIYEPFLLTVDTVVCFSRCCTINCKNSSFLFVSLSLWWSICVSLLYIITHFFLLNPKSKKSRVLCVCGWMRESERADAILGWLGKSWLPSVWEKCSWQALNWDILLCCPLKTHTHTTLCL